MSARREFTPHPGSVADRAIAYLQSQPACGTEVSSPALAEAIGVPASHLSASLEQARERGAVFARRKGGHLRSPLFWSLVDHDRKPMNGSRPPAPAEPTAEAPPQSPVELRAVVPTASFPLLHPALAGAFDPPPSSAPGADPLPLRVALWSDGSLELRRGSSLMALLLPDETRALVRYLERMAVAEGS